ncbi:AraC family transcriptional regulator [Lichenihabitans sp. Uapishka_5]|uniref:AraC family transcriptional regulator n=1 Tax=Lichenihabitans sp. Uapishka_5 TaxID=3037302 RepID=UPI0029E7CE82|nr:AraC family transcriptional regulator [Lichenihabitans sp. Uapishka_5]MDX7952370.1 AraC family transcriptional regulator [Lichenihabitans sp. Uapishka_5]
MEPNLEHVGVGGDQSFKVWSHGYPFRTVRWHFHPEYELHLVTATTGARYVGDHIGTFAVGDLVLAGPNLPHNWISDVPAGETVDERCVILQFTEALIEGCLTTFPELQFLQAVLQEAFRGVRFDPSVASRVAPLMRGLLGATGARRIALFIDILDVIGHAEVRMPLASPGFQPRPSAYLSAGMNQVLHHIGRHFTEDLSETELAQLSRQSVSTFARAFRKHTGLTFVQYVNSLRIELACQHLSQDELTVTAICHEVGFNNVSNFNRQFLTQKGMPPSKFRTMRRQGTRTAVAA